MQLLLNFEKENQGGHGANFTKNHAEGGYRAD
jgi:hypothetical protein